jgi:hypothetical protein
MCEDSTFTITLDYERKLDSPKINSYQISLEKPISKKLDMGVYLIYDDFDWYYTHFYYQHTQEKLVNVFYKIKYDLSNRWNIGAFIHYNYHNYTTESWNDATYYGKVEFNSSYFYSGLDIAYKTEKMVFGSGLRLFKSKSTNSIKNDISIFYKYNFFIKDYNFSALLNVNFYQYPTLDNLNSFFTGITMQKKEYTLGVSYCYEMTLWPDDVLQLSLKKRLFTSIDLSFHYNILFRKNNTSSMLSSEKINFGLGIGYNL